MNTTASTVTAREAAEVAAANASGRQPIVFVHGLWLLHSSWDAWKAYVEDRQAAERRDFEEYRRLWSKYGGQRPRGDY